MLENALIIAGGYLVGSIPFGVVVVRVCRGEDIRKQGSGNIGATNVWRTYGKWYGVPVLVLDTAKGFVPALVFSLTVSPLAGVLAGAAAMLGHARPIFLRFERGGKMVATGGGVCLALAPFASATAVAIWIVLAVLTRYMSVASLCASPAAGRRWRPAAVRSLPSRRSWAALARSSGS